MENPTSTIESVLSSFGGLCVELDSPDLPEGASPLNQDVDFLVGAVVTRPGVSGVYSYLGNDQVHTPGLGTSQEIIAGTLPVITQSASATGNGSTLHLTMPKAVAPGDQIVFSFAVPGSFNSLVDNFGHSYSTVSAGTGTLTNYLIQNSGTITFTLTANGSGTIYLSVVIIRGASASVIYGLTNTSGSSGSSPSITTLVGNNLIIGGASMLGSGPITPTDGKTPLTSTIQTGFSSTTATTVGSAASSSWSNPGAGGDTFMVFAFQPLTTEIGWTNPDNIASQLSATVSLTAGQASTLLQASLYPFTIPSTSAVTGIQVAVTGSASQTGIPTTQTPYFNYSLNGSIGINTPANLSPTVAGRNPSTGYVVGNLALDTNNNIQRCTTSGTTDSGTPTWSTTVGGLTTDGSVVWTCVKYIISIGDILCIMAFLPGSYNTGGNHITGVTDSSGNSFISVGSEQSQTDGPGGYLDTMRVLYAVAASNVSYGGTYNLTFAAASGIDVSYSFVTMSNLGNLGGQVQATGNYQSWTSFSTGSLGSVPANSFVISCSLQGIGQATLQSPFTSVVSSGGSMDFGYYIPASSGNITDTWDYVSPPVTSSWNSTLFYFSAVTGGGATNGSATIAPNSVLAASRALTLPAATGTVTVGSPTDTWGQAWTPALINSPAFGFSIQGFASTLPASFSVSNVSVTVWYTPPNPRNFNYIKSFTQSSGDSLTLALDAVGDIWQEDVQNTPNQLTPIFTAIEPNTFAVSCTAFEKEYIALSNLANGTDMPRQYNGRWIDRVSQVGPGVGPTVSFTATGYPITSITQPAAVSSLTAILWSSGPGTKAAAGNVITIYYGTGGTPSPGSAADPNVVVGGCVYLSGFPTINGQNVTGTYVVVSVQTTLGYNGHYWNTFCVQAGSSQLYDSFPASLGSASYNATVATLATSTPIPNVTAGSQLSVTGASVPAWDETWTVTGLVNAAQLQITNTQLTFNSSNPAQSTATYNYLVDAGVVSTFQPVAGGQVTIQNTTNGNGIFNGNNFSIASVSPSGSGPGSTGTFSVLLPATANINSQAETNATGFINGTQFRFEPGLGDVGTATNPILGNSTGGSVTQAGNLGSGTRQAVVFFQTRNGYLTQPSAPVTFTLSESANSITVANVPIGPPNVIARCIAFTGANGSNFFYIPQPVIVTINNQPTTYSATVINDNITTSATFTFTDAILLAATGIDIQGNDLFNQLELGSSLGSVLYASRVFWWGEQNKVPNFVNMSFDGGYLSTTTPMPAGWTALNVGGSLVASPQFGNAYYIQNTSGSNQSTWGLIVQSAYQDAYGVPIIFPQTQYSVRVTASCPSGVTTGQLSIQIASGSVIYGIINFPLANMTNSLQILTGTLLSTPFATQPPADIQLKVYAGLPNGGDVLIDRIEVYPLSQPNLPIQLRASYVDNPEAFDQNTGVLGVGSYNNQPVTGAFILHDNLYILKSRSMEYTIDNGTTEPYLWQVRQVSNKVGTPSIHGYDYGEEWAVIAAYDGVYVFGGGVPQKISQEIQPIWDSINWQYGNTIWVRNDISNKRVYIGVPIATPNKYMPQLPANANPTSPNVILCMSYREVNSVEELANRPPIHLTYTGKLVSWDLSRKWTVWNIQAPYGDFCIRPDTTEKLLICNGIANSKIYQLVPGQFNDDGAAINSNYTTYGFVKSDIGQATGLGAHNMFLLYGSMLVKGNGNLSVTEIPNTLDSPNAAALLPIPLYNPNPNGDTELPLNDNGCRFFIQVGTDAPNSWFQLSKMVLSMKPSLYPVRGAY